MAQKKKPAVDPVRAKAAQMRQAQERADRRTRIIVISAVAAIVLAVIAAVGGVIWKQQAQVNAARNVDASEVLGPYADGRPIIVNANGVVAEAGSEPAHPHRILRLLLPRVRRPRRVHG